MTISTGGRYEEFSGSGVDNSGPADNMNRIVYEDRFGTVMSAAFEVPQGAYGVLTAYNLENAAGAKFKVNGVTLGSSRTGSGGACCNGVEGSRIIRPVAGQTILFREQMRLGGNPWEVSESAPVMIVPVPGWYNCELNGEEFVGAGIQLELRIVHTALQLPDVYFPGTKGA